MRYIIILLLAGCSHIPIGELEDQYFLCTADGAQGCNMIAAELDRRYLVIEKRENREAGYCARIGVTCLHGDQATSFFDHLRR